MECAPVVGACAGTHSLTLTHTMRLAIEFAIDLAATERERSRPNAS